jgi:hypothetical protein
MTMFRRQTLIAAVGTIALVMVAPFAAAQQGATPSAPKWQPVVKTDTQEAFVNRQSIAAVDGTFEAKVKQDFTQPQPSAKKDKTFLSSRTTFRLDCTQRRLAVKEIRAYAGADLQGDQVQKMTSSDKYLQWMDAPADTVYGKILDYVCLTGPAG